MTHAKQLEMGIIPQGTKLTPRPKEIPAWDSQSADEKKVYMRLMENYAAFMAHTDYHVGRLIDSLEASGELDNTLIFYIVGDNGASAEGGLEGTFSEVASLLGMQLGLESTIKRLDEIGGPTSEPHVPVGWAWAMDAPFQWTKQVASHFGGTRNPLVVHWPKGIKAKGEQRTQFHHVIDVVPTILEACKIAEPKVVNGIAQKPIEGVSMLYSLRRRERQGQADDAVLRDVLQPGDLPRRLDGVQPLRRRRGTRPAAAATSARRRGSFTTSRRTSARRTTWRRRTRKSSKNLQAKFLEEAKKYDVFPLDPRFAERFDPKLRVGGEPPT